MTLLDVAMAHAARSPRRAAGADARGVVTIEMKTSFMRPGLGRAASRAAGCCTAPPRMAFCEGTIFDADGAARARTPPAPSST